MSCLIFALQLLSPAEKSSGFASDERGVMWASIAAKGEVIVMTVRSTTVESLCTNAILHIWPENRNADLIHGHVDNQSPGEP
jgi:hypothetical protein